MGNLIQFTVKKTNAIIILLLLVFNTTSNLYSQSNSRLDSLLELGDDLISLNDYQEAESKIDKVLELKETYPPAIEAKVRVLVLMDKYSKANRIVHRSLKDNPNYAPFHLYQAKILIEKEDFHNALKHSNKAIGLTKNDEQLLSKIYVTRGATYQKMNETQKALNDYSKALKINSHNPNVFVYRGYLYYKEEEYKEAIEDFEKVLELDPNNHYAHYNIGMSRFKQGDKLKACDAFHKACELGNKNACQMVISKCLRNKGD